MQNTSQVWVPGEWKDCGVKMKLKEMTWQNENEFSFRRVKSEKPKIQKGLGNEKLKSLHLKKYRLSSLTERQNQGVRTWRKHEHKIRPKEMSCSEGRKRKEVSSVGRGKWMKKSSVSQNKEKESQWRAGSQCFRDAKRRRYVRKSYCFIGSREDGGIKKIILNSGGA